MGELFTFSDPDTDQAYLIRILKERSAGLPAGLRTINELYGNLKFDPCRSDDDHPLCSYDYQDAPESIEYEMVEVIGLDGRKTFKGIPKTVKDQVDEFWATNGSFSIGEISDLMTDDEVDELICEEDIGIEIDWIPESEQSTMTDEELDELFKGFRI